MECIVIASLLAMVIGMLTGQWMRTALLPLAVVESEMVRDIIKHMIVDPSRLKDDLRGGGQE